MKPLTRLRLQLTAWYAGTFSLILFVLGVLVFTIIARRLAEELDESLVDSTHAAEQAQPHLPTELPVVQSHDVTLPDAADHISTVAVDHVPDWLL